MGRPSDFNKIWDLPEEEEKKEQQEYAYDEMSISEDEDVAEAYGTVRKQRRDSFRREGESNRLLNDNEVDDLIHFAQIAINYDENDENEIELVDLEEAAVIAELDVG